MARPNLLRIGILGGSLALLIFADFSPGWTQNASASQARAPSIPGTAVTLPFTMIPPSAFSTSYAQLSPAQKARHDALNKWGKDQNAQGVHVAWSRYTEAMVKKTLAREASYRQGKATLPQQTVPGSAP